MKNKELEGIACILIRTCNVICGVLEYFLDNINPNVSHVDSGWACVLT